MPRVAKECAPFRSCTQRGSMKAHNPVKTEKMALITCPECQGSLSTLAASCPHCGAIPAKAKNSTDAAESHIPGPPSPGNLLCGLIGLVGLICLFIIRPVGLLMLMTAGFFGLFTTKAKVAVLVGKCPSCSALIKLRKDVQGAPCPICSKPFLNKGGRFEEV